jgi:hypothetical protein
MAANAKEGRQGECRYCICAFRGRRETLRMSLAHTIIAGLWLLFVAYWAVAAMGAKRNAGSRV